MINLLISFIYEFNKQLNLIVNPNVINFVKYWQKIYLIKKVILCD